MLLRWEKSRLSHQVRRMQEQGLVARELNPADRRSAMIDLFTRAELDTLAGLNERILRHLAGEPCPEGARE